MNLIVDVIPSVKFGYFFKLGSQIVEVCIQILLLTLYRFICTVFFFPCCDGFGMRVLEQIRVVIIIINLQ